MWFWFKNGCSSRFVFLGFDLEFGLGFVILVVKMGVGLRFSVLGFWVLGLSPPEKSH